MVLHTQKIFLLIINIVGGAAVLFSYIHGILTHPGAGDILWGQLPGNMKPLYTVSMLSAATGYLIFTGYLFFAVKPEDVLIAGRFPYMLFNWLYVVILVLSALWMPLTFLMAQSPSLPLWIAIRLVLFSVGIGSLVMLAALVSLRTHTATWAYVLSVLGAVAFSIQIAILDALVWPAYFPRNL